MRRITALSPGSQLVDRIFALKSFRVKEEAYGRKGKGGCVLEEGYERKRTSGRV